MTRPQPTRAATGHMPFVGHRTVAEAMPVKPLPVHLVTLADIERHPPRGAAKVIHDALQREIAA